MAIVKTEISNLENIFKHYKLKIPDYQRPYLWSVESVKKIFFDILQAYNDTTITEYRIGIVILYKEDDLYNIVDGQQRLITLSLLIYLLDNNSKFLFNEEINPISNKSIISNFNYLKEVIINIINKDDFKQFILDKCTVGVIITDEQEEAFQFFDSQNSRGKNLAPHDILKAYHLREMKDKEKTKVVEEWESIEESRLKVLFADYLFPIKQWSQCQNKQKFTLDNVDIYEGVPSNKKYNYILYRLHNVNNENKENYVFQLNEEIFSGEYFFEYIFHYNKLLSKLLEIPNDRNDIIILGNQPYINTLFYCALLMYADRFNLDELYKKIKEIYKWSYGLRLSRIRVDRHVINKYATGRYNDLGCGPFFKIINEMNNPDDILKYNPIINDKKHNKYNKIRNLIMG